MRGLLSTEHTAEEEAYNLCCLLVQTKLSYDRQSKKTIQAKQQQTMFITNPLASACRLLLNCEGKEDHNICAVNSIPMEVNSAGLHTAQYDSIYTETLSVIALPVHVDTNLCKCFTR